MTRSEEDDILALTCGAIIAGAVAFAFVLYQEYRFALYSAAVSAVAIVALIRRRGRSQL